MTNKVRTSDVIQNYLSNVRDLCAALHPPQSSSYGGVKGGDGGIAGKGQQALSTNGAAAEVISSGNTNPAVSIDPNAPYITNGKSAEDNADSIADGTNSQCTDTTVSKSTFENYTCSADVAVSQTCVRNATPGVEGSTTVVKQTLDLEHVSFTRDDWTFYFKVKANITGTVTRATYSYNLNSGNDHYFYPVPVPVTFLGATLKPTYRSTGTDIPFAPTQRNITAGQLIPVTEARMIKVSNGLIINQTPRPVTVTLTIEQSTAKPVVTWNETCPAQKAGTLRSSVCTQAGGTRTVSRDGHTYSVSSSCWQYTDTYVLSEATEGTCGSLKSNSACTQSGSACTENASNGACSHKVYTFQCQKTYSSSGLLCGGSYFCQTGDCSDTNGAGDNGFDTAVAKLAGLASAGEDIKKDQVNVKAFTGDVMSCRKAAAGFSNCCKDSGWGQDVGLMKCNSDEKALGKAKEKKITVSVGERCDHKVLGVCVQKSQVYCVFGGKLARIIQEQGRRDQLGIGFGTGDSPNCAGITVPQLQSINFDKINFSDFYSDLMNNQKIPDTASMVAQVKQKIAAQVNQTTGGTTK